MNINLKLIATTTLERDSKLKEMLNYSSEMLRRTQSMLTEHAQFGAVRLCSSPPRPRGTATKILSYEKAKKYIACFFVII